MSYSPPGTITGAGTANTLSKWTAGSVLGNSLVTDDGTTVAVATASTFLAAAPSTGSSGFLSITGTLPSITTASIEGVFINITGAGNSVQNQFALASILHAGYTGSRAAVSVYAFNSSACTQDPWQTSGGPLANTCVFGDGTGTGAVSRVGIYGRMVVGTGSGYGVIGRSNESGSAAANVGGTFIGRGGTVNVGAYISCLANGFSPTFVSSALQVDNHTAANPIALFQDNGITKVTIADGGSLNLAAGKIEPLVSTAINLTLTDQHIAVLVDASAGNRVITLPSAAANAGRVYLVKKTDATANLVTVTPAGGDLIDGAATLVISAQNQAFEVRSDGTTQWFIF